MANLTRYAPFEDELAQLLPGFFQPISRRAASADSLVKMDVVDTEQAYLVSVDLPGLKKDEIHVSIYENQLTINAERREEKEAGAKSSVLLSERSYGKISRTIALPQLLDDSSAQAKHENGVLHLTLPKRASSMAKKLDIN